MEESLTDYRRSQPSQESAEGLEDSQDSEGAGGGGLRSQRSRVDSRCSRRGLREPRVMGDFDPSRDAYSGNPETEEDRVMMEARREEFGPNVGPWQPQHEMNKKMLYGDHGPNVVESRRLSVGRSAGQIAAEPQFDQGRFTSWV